MDRVHRRWLTFGIVGIVAGFIVGYSIYVFTSGNFRTVTPGECYRSGQLTGKQLVDYHKKYGIRSVLNLRGELTEYKLYQEEIKICEQLNIKHYDVKLSAKKEPTPGAVNEILGIFDSAPRPILIHCLGGSDRASLVSAMWKVWVDGASKEEAKKQMSIWYGHMPVGETSAMDEFFDTWADEITQEQGVQFEYAK